MLTLFEWLYNALHAAPLLAFAASFIWGVLSILLSPCHLASIPLIIGFIDTQGGISTKRAFYISLVFAVGILVSIALIGAITAAAGRMMGDVGKIGNYLVAAIFFIVGLYLLGLFPMPWSGPENISIKRKGLLASFILGLVLGIALGPCTFAYMAPILGITFALAADNIIYGISLLVVYGVGHCSVIVAAGTSSEAVQRYLNWTEHSKGTRIVKIVCGILVIGGGIYLIHNTSNM